LKLEKGRNNSFNTIPIIALHHAHIDKEAAIKETFLYLYLKPCQKITHGHIKKHLIHMKGKKNTYTVDLHQIETNIYRQ